MAMLGLFDGKEMSMFHQETLGERLSPRVCSHVRAFSPDASDSDEEETIFTRKNSRVLSLSLKG